MHRTVLAAAALVSLTVAPAALAQARPAAQSAAAPSQDAEAFARAAAEANLAEVLMATVALQKTGDKRVQDHAWMMLDHHARAMGNLAEALMPGAAALPGAPGAEALATLARMRAMTTAAFDAAYFAQQAEAHQRSTALYERGARLGDAGLAGYARATLPILRAHGEIVAVRQAQPAEPLQG